MLKICTKVERNRTNCCCVIHDLASFSSEANFPTLLTRGGGGVVKQTAPNLWRTELHHRYTERNTLVPTYCVFQMTAALRQGGVGNRRQFSRFWPPVKIRGGIGRMLRVRIELILWYKCHRNRAMRGWIIDDLVNFRQRYVTLTSDLWPWTFVVHRVSCVQILYGIWTNGTIRG